MIQAVMRTAVKLSGSQRPSPSGYLGGAVWRPGGSEGCPPEKRSGHDGGSGQSLPYGASAAVFVVRYVKNTKWKGVTTWDKR